MSGKAWIPVAAVALAVGGFGASLLGSDEQATADPDPVSCTGYPEPRVAYESQQWWSQDSDDENPQPDDTLNGRDEHTHVRVCLPAPGVAVSGQVRFDLQWQIHEMSDGYLKRVRIQSASNTIVTVDTQAATQRCLGLDQCAGTQTIMLDTDAMATGVHELRFHAESERTDDSGALATNGWHVCVRTCGQLAQQSGRAVVPPAFDARGRWFETIIGGDGDIGYMTVRVLSGYPANTEGYIPLAGIWSPRIESNEGVPNDAPVIGTFVSIDPRWHDYSVPGYPDGYPGRVVLDYHGDEIDRVLQIDTAELTDGMHKLFIRTEGQAASGKTAGVQVIEFLVRNGEEPPPPTTTAEPPPTTTTVPPTTTAPPANPAPTVTIDEPSRTYSGWWGVDVTASADTVSATYYVDGVQVAQDSSQPDFGEPINTATLCNGPHTLRVEVRDAEGAAGEASLPFSSSNSGRPAC